jgi:hypothetical protein
MNIEIETFTITTTGNAGSATGTATSKLLYGRLLDVHIAYHASAPVTTVVDVSTSVRATHLLTAPASKTTTLFTPRVAICDLAGASPTTKIFDLCTLNTPVVVTVTACNALTDAVVVTLRYMSN